MDEKILEALVMEIRTATTTPNVREASRAQLDVILASDLTHHLGQLSADISQAQKTLGARMTELAGELHKSSESASPWAKALVKWTACLAVVTSIYTIWIIAFQSRDGGGASGAAARGSRDVRELEGMGEQPEAESRERRHARSRSRMLLANAGRSVCRPLRDDGRALQQVKTLAAQGPRKLPKLDVAGSTPVARSS